MQFPGRADRFGESREQTEEINQHHEDVRIPQELALLTNLLVIFFALLREAPQQFRSLAVVFLLVILNGCMYSPRYEDTFAAAAEEVPYGTQYQRKQRIITLTSLNDLDQASTAIITTEIRPCQRNRILENMEYMMEEASDAEFDRCMTLYEKAKKTCGIMNPDRYSPRLLEEFVLNYESRERHADRNQILVLTSRKDHEQEFDIQALSVESHRLEELIDDWKVIAIETGSFSEIQAQLDLLEKNGILEVGKLSSVLVVSHGNQDRVENGLTKENVQSLARLNRFFVANTQPLFIYFSCLAAEGENKEMNMVGATKIVLPRARVIGSTTRVESVDFELDERGHLIPETLELGTFFNPINRLFEPNRLRGVNLQSHILMRQLQETYECGRDYDFFKEVVQQGIIKPSLAQVICTEALRPEIVAALAAAGWEANDFVHHNPQVDLSWDLALQYARAGVRKRLHMIRLSKNKISPLDIEQLQGITRSLRINNTILHPDTLVMLREGNVTQHQLIAALYQGETDPLKIVQAVRIASAREKVIRVTAQR